MTGNRTEHRLGRWLVLLSILVSCGAAGHASRADWLSTDEDTQMVCFSAQSEEGESLMACSVTKNTCAKMRSAAIEYGGMLKVAKVGKCQDSEVGSP